MDSTWVASFSDIYKSYGDTPALRGVSLEVGGGEVLGLLGPNGAGKTTLIRILLDIIRPDAGSVSVFGKPLSRRVFVPQGPIGSDEVRVAERTYRIGPILFPPRPEIAASKPQKNRGASGVCPFALDRVVDLFH